MPKLTNRTMRSIIYLIAWLIAALALVPSTPAQKTPEPTTPGNQVLDGGVAHTAQNPSPLPSDATLSAPYPVVHVVDGDTIDVKKDGKKVRVRLIGLNTPEVVDPRRPVQCFGTEASAEAHRILDGQSVQLETDPSQDLYDKYGRLLAYVWLTDGTNFNEYQIAHGFGYEYTYDLPYKYQKGFKAAQAAARTAGLGLWAPGACADAVQ